MNKTDFINALAEKANLTVEQAACVNDIFEERNVLRKRNEPFFVTAIAEKLSVEEGRAKEIYDCAYDQIGSGIIGRLRHPFGEREA